jgi:hypothetical protein
MGVVTSLYEIMLSYLADVILNQAFWKEQKLIRKARSGQVQCLTPVILVSWEVEMGRFSEASMGESSLDPISTNGQACVCLPS